MEVGIAADRVPGGINFQARNGDSLARWDRKKFSQILYCFLGNTGLRLNLGQGGQVAGTEHRVFFGRQQLECLSRDIDRLNLAVKRELNPAQCSQRTKVFRMLPESRLQ